MRVVLGDHPQLHCIIYIETMISEIIPIVIHQSDFSLVYSPSMIFIY